MTTVAGVRFPDNIAALLDHAVAHGFRVEPKGAGVIAYPPDPTKPGIPVVQRGPANPTHTDNIRRDLVRAGMPPPPRPGTIGAALPPAALTAAASAATPPEPTVTKLEALAPPALSLGDSPHGTRSKPGSLLLPAEPASPKATAVRVAGDTIDLTDPAQRIVNAVEVVSKLSTTIGMPQHEANLASELFSVVATWVESTSSDSVAKAIAKAKAQDAKDLEEALRLAGEFEQQALTAQRRVVKLEREKADLVEQLKSARTRGDAAVADLAELRAGLVAFQKLTGGLTS